MFWASYIVWGRIQYFYIIWSQQNSIKVHRKVLKFFLTSVMSLDAAAALKWRLDSFEALLVSKARANVPIDLSNKSNKFLVNQDSNKL